MAQIQITQPQIGEWRYGFCDCCGNMMDCLLGWCVGPIYAGYTAYKAYNKDDGEKILMGVINCLVYPFPLCCLRGKVRDERGIEGSAAKDFFAAICCPCCTNIQISRELGLFE